MGEPTQPRLGAQVSDALLDSTVVGRDGDDLSLRSVIAGRMTLLLFLRHFG